MKIRNQMDFKQAIRETAAAIRDGSIDVTMLSKDSADIAEADTARTGACRLTRGSFSGCEEVTKQECRALAHQLQAEMDWDPDGTCSDS